MTTAPKTHPDEAMLAFIERLKRDRNTELPNDLAYWQELGKLVKNKTMRANTPELFESVLTAIAESDNVFKQLLSRRHSSNGHMSPSRPQHKPTDKSMVEVIRPEQITPPLPDGIALPTELSRAACVWLDEYAAFSGRWSPEGYKRFHTAIGAWVLSAIAARRVFIPFGPGGDFTPLFIALVAPTTTYAKSTTARIGKALLREVGLGWLLSADQITPSKLLSNMAGRWLKAYENLPAEKRALVEKRYAMSGQVAWFYDEFGQMLEAMTAKNGIMVDFKGMLRRFDDCPHEISNDTQTRDLEIIENPYLAMLASMTPADAKPHAGKDAKFWKDGFFARVAFITPPPERCFPARFPEGEMHFSDSLTQPLINWHSRLGEPQLTFKTSEQDGVTPMRDKFPMQKCTFGSGVVDAYYRYRSALNGMVYTHRLEDLAGNYGRMGSKALRLAALFASLENDNTIEIRHWAKAQGIAEQWRDCLHELYSQVNERNVSEADALEEIILQFLKDHASEHTIREMKQRSRHLKNIPSKAMEEALDTLVKDGTVDRVKKGQTQTYKVGGK